MHLNHPKCMPFKRVETDSFFDRIKRNFFFERAGLLLRPYKEVLFIIVLQAR